MCSGVTPSRGRAWTQAEADKLSIYWGLGLPVAAIAEKLDRTRGSVIGKADRLNLPEHERKQKQGERK